MFYAKIAAHILGVCALLSSVALLRMAPSAAALSGVIALIWSVVIVAMCVKHWTRPRAT